LKVISMMIKVRFAFFWLFLIAIGCSNDELPVKKEVAPVTLEKLDFSFRELGFDQTGINFQNKIFETDELNYFAYEYLYNGGGVSIADFDNDGLDDLFYTCSMGFNRLYKNNGGLKFQDLSKTSGIRSSRDWCTGTTIVDINKDGLLDLYVSRSGWFENANLRSNLLYINKGNFQFEEQSSQYGIDDKGYSTQSSFFDADGDGDLDLYVMNHPIKFSEELQEFLTKVKNPPAYQSDNFYENVNGKFTNASEKWGVRNYGHGLGLVTSDFNNDGKIDVYVSNDYQQHDFLYINKGGKFVESSREQLRHMAKFSMGVDAADFNDDGLIDIMAVEMMPADNYRKKTNMANMNPDLYYTFLNNGLQDQEMHNALQVNSGNGSFTDEAYMRGVAESDWSWAPLFADFDGDLSKDLFVSNGYRRDILNKDIKKTIAKTLKKENFKFTEVKDFYKMHLSQNAFYKNIDNTFSKKESSGFDSAFNTNGASYSDLDNDGDLDIVCNNMESVSIIYENLSQPKSSVQINLSTDTNPFGLGSRIDVKIGGQIYTYTNSPTRGFQSSVPPYIHIPGIKSSQIEEIKVVWPGGKREKFDSDFSNTIKLVKGNGKKTTKSKAKKIKVDIIDFDYTYKEKEIDDYKLQPLLPYKISEQGPFQTKADLDGIDGDEIFITGGSGQSASIYSIQNGNLKKNEFGKDVLVSQKDFEDSGVCVFDINNDGLNDLYVTRGSYESTNSNQLQDIIYINTGNGFRIEKSPITSNSLFPVSLDFDQDGDEDIFVGGGVIPGKYPIGSSSYILTNDNGKLIKSKLELEQSAIITGAQAFDVDNDGSDEIVVIGEWMAPQIFKWTNNEWSNISNNYFPHGLKGLWSALHIADIDNDGVNEILLGNLGLNTKYKASPSEPFHCYSNDFDDNGTSEIVLASFEDGKEYPIRGKQCSSEQLPSISKSIETYDIFAKSDVVDIYGDKLKNGQSYSCEQLASGYLKLNNSGKYNFIQFPTTMQKSRIYTFEIARDQNGCTKLFYHGNLTLEVETGKLDAFNIEAYDFCQVQSIDFEEDVELNKIRSMVFLDDTFSKLLFLQNDGKSKLTTIFW
jgi:hypothetical protein